MSNGFEFFEGARSESQTPQVTVRRSGLLVLTQAAVAMLGEDVTHVQVGFNAGSGIIGIRAASNGAKGRYRLRAQVSLREQAGPHRQAQGDRHRATLWTKDGGACRPSADRPPVSRWTSPQFPFPKRSSSAPPLGG